jgi:hypothetical protein
MALGAGYLGYPYATLYRLDTAMRRSDASTLRSLVDWYAVREGLKEDICDMVLDEPASARPSNELAPFGAGFVRLLECAFRGYLWLASIERSADA